MPIDLSLDRLRHLLRYIQPYTRPTAHIAGTNGKGSVTAILSSILLASCPTLSVGRFNSPHLVTVRDSIAINGETVIAESYDSARRLVEELDIKHGTRLTNFELLTVTALLIFEREKVDIAVIEVGLGGRLDATNVVSDEAICISALTAVGLDHQSFLGDTPAAIAKEKAAIARKGKPFVLGRQEFPEVEEVAINVADNAGGHVIKAVQVLERDWDPQRDGERSSHIHLSPDDFRAPSGQPVSLLMPCFSDAVHTVLPLHGLHQLDNLAVASTIVSTLLTHPSCSELHLKDRITLQSVDRGVRRVQWPGRLAFHKVRLGSSGNPWTMVALVDGAHNPASAMTLSTYISELLSLLSPKCSKLYLTYILALSHSPPKTPLQTLAPLLPPRIPNIPGTSREIIVNVAAVAFTPPDGMPWVRPVKVGEVIDAIRALAPESNVLGLANAVPRLEDALSQASGLGLEEDESVASLVVIAGSLYLAADFYRLLRDHGGTVTSI